MTTTSELREKLRTIRSRVPGASKKRKHHTTPHELWMKMVDDTFSDGSELNQYMGPYRVQLKKVKFEKDGTIVLNESGRFAQYSFPSIVRKYRAAFYERRVKEGDLKEEKTSKKKKKKKGHRD